MATDAAIKTGMHPEFLVVGYTTIKDGKRTTKLIVRPERGLGHVLFCGSDLKAATLLATKNHGHLYEVIGDGKRKRFRLFWANVNAYTHGHEALYKFALSDLAEIYEI